MRVSTLSLTDAVNVTSGVVADSAAMRVLSMVGLRTAENGDLLIMGTDLVGAVTLRVAPLAEGGQVGGDVNGCVPCNTLKDLLSVTDTASVTLSWDDNNAALRVVTTNGEAVVKGLPIEEFPVIERHNEKPWFTCSAVEYLEALNIVAKSVSKTRPLLAGVHHAVSDGQLTLIGADGFRASIARVSVETEHAPLSVTLPLHLTSLKRYANTTEVETLVFSVAQDDKVRSVTAAVGRASLAVIPIDGDYPRVLSLLPLTLNNRVAVNCRSLRQAVRRVKTMADHDTKALKMETDGDALVLHCESLFAGQATDRVASDVEGAFTVNVNAEFLSKALEGFEKDDDVNVFFNGSGPLIIKDAAASDRMIQAIMPIG